MKKANLLNPDIVKAVAELGHTDYFVVADAGLPVPDGKKAIDVSVAKGIPAFIEVLGAVAQELVVESFIYAEEADEKNPAVVAGMKEIFPGVPFTKVTHEEFKKYTNKAKTIVRTGECSPYANVVLVGGVNF